MVVIVLQLPLIALVDQNEVSRESIFVEKGLEEEMWNRAAFGKSNWVMSGVLEKSRAHPLS